MCQSCIRLSFNCLSALLICQLYLGFEPINQNVLQSTPSPLWSFSQKMWHLPDFSGANLSETVCGTQRKFFIENCASSWAASWSKLFPPTWVFRTKFFEISYFWWRIVDFFSRAFISDPNCGTPKFFHRKFYSIIYHFSVEKIPPTWFFWKFVFLGINSVVFAWDELLWDGVNPRLHVSCCTGSLSVFFCDL